MRATLILLLGLGGCWHAFPEGSRDTSGARELGLERGAADRTADHPRGDRLSDRGHDATEGSPCRSGNATLRWFDPSGPIAACEAIGAAVTQCDAKLLCAKGTWEVCRATRYRYLFGVLKPPPPLATGAWVRGTIRLGGGVSLLGDFFTASCSAGGAPCALQNVAVSCQTQGSVTSPECYLGLATTTSCWKVGTDEVDGFWEVTPGWSTRNAALCCPTEKDAGS